MAKQDTILVFVVDKENEQEFVIALEEERELAHFLLHYDTEKYEIVDIEKKVGQLTTKAKDFFIKPPSNFEHGKTDN
jgi:hypothetical protein